MHEHDLDLIMALAEGTLDASDVPSAEAEIAACAECSEDLELQRLALGALEAAPPVAMTEMESSRMRRTLRHELGLVPAAKAGQAPAPLVPIGALGIRRRTTAGAGRRRSRPRPPRPRRRRRVSEVAAFSQTTTTSAAAEADDGAALSGSEAPSAAANESLEEAAADLTTTTQSATTTTSAAAETTTMAPPAAATAMQFSTEPNLATLEDAIIRLGITADTDLAQFEEQLRALGLAFELTTTGRAAYTQECLAAGVDSIAGATSGYPLGEAPYGGGDAMVAVYETETPGDVVVAVQDTTTCEVLDASP